MEKLPPELEAALLPKLTELRAHIQEIGKRRDALRTLIDDIEEIIDCVSDGVDSLQYGVERISEQL